ncbi:ABC transporter ATP-binding protein [Saccharophagus sp. K07]|jgi:microcin C transport system ATP-binding protein|uniref:ABC transporter ATP-binding protein n=1 Tax=Saccharophagus sp. K07 TaxID=2283636 RepID=UPI001651CBC2|nr:ABC transporter ATP-binding protein [Saccharophagus sp. K07]MBC6905459.1 ABC transporter ATP-binding protein [Saccharophagus sp. K07]
MSQNPLLRVQSLTVSFGREANAAPVVRNVSFQLSKGETLALVGESGSGKSVTAHAIMRLLPYPFAWHPPESEIWFDGQQLLQMPEKAMNHLRGNRIGMIFQEPMTALNPLHTVEKQIGEVLRLHNDIRGDALRSAVLEQLERVRIPDPASKLRAYPHELSGGQRQRVMIAMALANKPELLIADEPTTALDVTVQKQIMELLRDLQRELGMAMLLITHDLGVVRHFSDRVAVMRRGELVEQNTREALFANPQHEYTRHLLESEPRGEPLSVSLDAPVIMRAKELTVKFPKEKPFFRAPRKFLLAVDQANIQVQKGSTLGIVGESGSGKSTLAMALLRLVGSSGEIRLDDMPIQHLNQRELRPLRSRIQVVFQDPFASLSPRMTVQQIIAEGLEIHKKSASAAENEAAVIKALQDVGLDPETRHRYPHEFSGGQRQRIAIARALVLNPELIFLDEPTSALDRAVQVQVIDLLRDLQARYQLSYVLISHDLKVIRALSHHVLVMRAGKIVESGAADEILNNPQQAYTQELLAASLG